MSCNHLYILLQLFPDNPWDIVEISKNPTLYWATLLSLHEQSWLHILENPTFTSDDFTSGFHSLWGWNPMDLQHNFTKYTRHIDFYRTPSLAVFLIFAFLKNPNLTLVMVEYFADSNLFLFSYEFVSRLLSNPRLGFSFLQSYPHVISQLIPDYYSLISNNPSLTFDFICQNSDFDWNWDELSYNPNITWDILTSNPDLPFTLVGFSNNPNLTWDIVQSFPDKHWNWNDISRHKCVTWPIVVNNPSKPWNWNNLSINSNITWDIIKSHPDKPWNMRYVSLNESLSWKIVAQNPDAGWDWKFLSRNTFRLYSPAVKIQRSWRRYRRYLAALRIQQWWKSLYYRPGGPFFLKANSRFTLHPHLYNTTISP